MKLLQEINLMDDKKLIVWLNIATLPLLALFGLLFTMIPLWFGQSSEEGSVIVELFVVAIGYLLAIVVHELIHGLFFKLFNPDGNVKFGFKNGLAYATSPGSFYTKGQFSVILLSPFILISLTLNLFYLTSLLGPVSFVILSAAHAASCVGDFYFMYLIARTPAGTYIEDTEKGLSFYAKEETAE